MLGILFHSIFLLLASVASSSSVQVLHDCASLYSRSIAFLDRLGTDVPSAASPRIEALQVLDKILRPSMQRFAAKSAADTIAREDIDGVSETSHNMHATLLVIQESLNSGPLRSLIAEWKALMDRTDTMGSSGHRQPEAHIGDQGRLMRETGALYKKALQFIQTVDTGSLGTELRERFQLYSVLLGTHKRTMADFETSPPKGVSGQAEFEKSLVVVQGLLADLHRNCPEAKFKEQYERLGEVVVGFKILTAWSIVIGSKFKTENTTTAAPTTSTLSDAERDEIIADLLRSEGAGTGERKTGKERRTTASPTTTLKETSTSTVTTTSSSTTANWGDLVMEEEQFAILSASKRTTTSTSQAPETKEFKTWRKDNGSAWRARQTTTAVPGTKPAPRTWAILKRTSTTTTTTTLKATSTVTSTTSKPITTATSSTTTEKTPSEAKPTEKLSTEPITTEKTVAVSITTAKTPSEAKPTESANVEPIRTQQTVPVSITPEETPSEAKPTESANVEPIRTEQTSAEAITTEKTPSEAKPTESANVEPIRTESSTTDPKTIMRTGATVGTFTTLSPSRRAPRHRFRGYQQQAPPPPPPPMVYFGPPVPPPAVPIIDPMIGQLCFLLDQSSLELTDLATVCNDVLRFSPDEASKFQALAIRNQLETARQIVENLRMSSASLAQMLPRPFTPPPSFR
jgi:hypothetical protein